MLSSFQLGRFAYQSGLMLDHDDEITLDNYRDWSPFSATMVRQHGQALNLRYQDGYFAEELLDDEQANIAD